jgi:hypothetical protein
MSKQCVRRHNLRSMTFISMMMISVLPFLPGRAAAQLSTMTTGDGLVVVLPNDIIGRFVSAYNFDLANCQNTGNPVNCQGLAMGQQYINAVDNWYQSCSAGDNQSCSSYVAAVNRLRQGAQAQNNSSPTSNGMPSASLGRCVGAICGQSYGNWSNGQNMMRHNQGTGLPGGYGIANPYKGAPLAPGGQ